ncbi:MAG: TIGR04282 family arsenosugar biosynthesis glycosyltransferase [Gemmatimonadales bacterium]
MSPALAIFLKAPRLGTVKTRLAAEIGDVQALGLYREMVSRTLAAAREATLDPTVWFSPVDAAEEMRLWLGEDWTLRPQSAGDLGARLATAAQSVARGRGWIAIGADCPRLGVAVLREAGALVARGEVVLGPSADGGYYLIGGPAPLPPVFTGIRWSTSEVLDQTRTRLAAAGVAWRELPTLRDVDTAADARAEGLLT